MGKIVCINESWFTIYPTDDDYKELYPSLYAGIFYESYSLEKITLPRKIRSIDKNAFYHCINLKSIIIPDCVEVIDDDAFSGCAKLESVVLPKELKRIYTTSFRECPFNDSMRLQPLTELIDPFEDRDKDSDSRIFLDSNIPFTPNKLQIIFIDKGNNKFLSEYFEENYDKVNKYFQDNGVYEFVYVPHLINMFKDENVCRYYRPSGNISKKGSETLLKYNLIDDFVMHLANKPLRSSFIRSNCDLPVTTHVNLKRAYKFSYDVLEPTDEESLWQELDK